MLFAPKRCYVSCARRHSFEDFMSVADDIVSHHKNGSGIPPIFLHTRRFFLHHGEVMETSSHSRTRAHVAPRIALGLSNHLPALEGLVRAPLVRAARARARRRARQRVAKRDGPQNPVFGAPGRRAPRRRLSVATESGALRWCRRCPHPECWRCGRGGTKPWRQKRPRGFFVSAKRARVRNDTRARDPSFFYQPFIHSFYTDC
jgi:hypothetical protein